MDKLTFIIKEFYLTKIQRKDANDFRLDYFRSKGVTIGSRVRAFSDIISAEPYLLSVGDDTTISSGVKFTTHDNSVTKVLPEKTDIFGKISIGSNCFIGQNSLFLPGVTLGNNIIVAAGSVVTKSFHEENIIIGGNPAKKISTWDQYKQKYEYFALSTRKMNFDTKKDYLQKNSAKFIVK